MIARYLFIISLLWSFLLQANILSEEERLSDFAQLLSTIKSGYAPLQFKKIKIGLDLEKLVNDYSEKIKACKTNGQFYYLMVKFVAHFEDGHFGIRIPTNHKSFIPFSVDLIDGHILIDDIKRELLSEEEFPFEKGDEIVKVNGQDVWVTLNELQKYINAGNDLSRQRTSAMLLTYRPGSLFPVPTGNITFSVRRGTSLLVEEVELKWHERNKPFDEFYVEKDLSNYSDNFPLGELSSEYIWKELLGERLEQSYSCSGDTRIDIPSDATIILKKPFVAYYHKSEMGNIGYLRIPHYSPRNSKTGKSEHELRFRQYEYAIRELEKNTVGLVIDQDHNCGGSVSYLEDIVSLFMDKKFPPLPFRFRASKELFLNIYSWLKNESPHTIPYTNLKKVADTVWSSWKNDEFLTAMLPFGSNEELHPNEFTYNKPILILIDEMAGSGGDAFPGMMQGLGRAKLFGQTTAALGGHVSAAPSLNYSQLKIRMTRSLFFRPDGVEVENNGVSPDLYYTPNRNDFLYRYKEYQQAYLSALFKILSRQSD